MYLHCALITQKRAVIRNLRYGQKSHVHVGILTNGAIFLGENSYRLIFMNENVWVSNFFL